MCEPLSALGPTEQRVVAAMGLWPSTIRGSMTCATSLMRAVRRHGGIRGLAVGALMAVTSCGSDTFRPGERSTSAEGSAAPESATGGGATLYVPGSTGGRVTPTELTGGKVTGFPNVSTGGQGPVVLPLAGSGGSVFAAPADPCPVQPSNGVTCFVLGLECAYD